MDSQTVNRKVTKIEVDKDACIGAATCVALAGKAFQLNSKGIAEVLGSAFDQTDDELIDAAKSCPTQAIKLFDSEGKEIKL